MRGRSLAETIINELDALQRTKMGEDFSKELHSQFAILGTAPGRVSYKNLRRVQGKKSYDKRDLKGN